MVVLKTIDLFSGVGGITLALHGIARPVMYCDVDPVARSAIAHNIKRGKLPRAPIHPDVTKLASPPPADMVVGGFPCVGFSSLGKLEGLKQVQSGLFYEMLKVVDASGADAVFLENVPGVVNSIGPIVRELAVKRGFQLRWTVVRASDLGAPHVRARWFCLGVRAGSRVAGMRIDALGGYKPHAWGGKTAPPRTCGKTAVDRAMQARIDARSGLMGNSVVPDAVRLAFLRLFTGGAYADLRTPGRLAFEASPATTKGGGALEGGAAATDSVSVVEAGTKTIRRVMGATPLVRLRPKCQLVLDPGLVPPPKTRSPMQTTETLTAPATYALWSTPRHGMKRPSRVLTERSSKDLPTQIRFERGTKMRMTPMTAAFQEWMMGYPTGFTDVAGDGV